MTVTTSTSLTTSSPASGRPAPARINPDTRTALGLAMLATGCLVSVSFVLSFAGLSALAPWASVPHMLAPLVPLFIDGAILVYTYSALAARARRELTVRPWAWVAMWTTVSALANGAHAWAYGPGGWHGVVGAVLAALFPVGSLLGCHEIADRMIARPDADERAVDTTSDAIEEMPAPARRMPAGCSGSSASREPARRGLLEEHRGVILARAAAGESGRAIAASLGLGRTSVCAVIADARRDLERTHEGTTTADVVA